MHFKLAAGGDNGDGKGGDGAIKVLISIQSSYKTDVNIPNYNVVCWRLYFLHFCEYL
jgi:hypothetical protein